jgi:hypothetical protein
MKNIKNLGAFFALISLLSACKTTADTEVPTIELLSISPTLTTDTICGTVEPNNVIRLRSGQDLQFQLRLKDNEGLSQYKIDIHENFDCHGHKAITVSPWQVLQIVDINGTDLTETKTISVPANATAGTYHFQIRLLDLSGNEAGGSEAYSILLTNEQDSIAPTLSITSPAQSTVSLNRGQVLSVSGNVSDNEALDGGRLELVYFTLSGNRVVASTLNLDASMGTNYNYNLNYTLPTSLPTGNYEFEMRVFDAVGNSFFSPSFVVQLN